jgi:hypothetical protein
MATDRHSRSRSSDADTARKGAERVFVEQGPLGRHGSGLRAALSRALGLGEEDPARLPLGAAPGPNDGAAESERRPGNPTGAPLVGTRGYGLWQDVGRSDAGPVHWPLWPAPFPPLVGGLGLAHAADAVPNAIPLTIAAAARRFFM